MYTSVDPLQSMSREEKLDILRRVDKVAREANKRVQEVTASLSGVYELILVAATDGTLAADVRPLVRLSVSVLVEEDGKRERGAVAAAVVLVMSSSLPILTAKSVRMHGQRSSAYGAGQSFCRCCTSGHHASSTWRRLAGVLLLKR